MNDVQIAKPHQLWQTGGIISEIEWGPISSVIPMWDGTREKVEFGDKVLVLRRGLPFVQFVKVTRQ